MRRIAFFAGMALVAFGCSREKSVDLTKQEMSRPVKEAIYRICKLERTSPSEHSVKILDMRGKTAAEFRSELMAFAGEEVHVWMPGEHDWLLIGNHSTNQVSLAQAMEVFAGDTNCVVSIPEVFASYVGTREEVLPAFTDKLQGEVVPEWFVTKDIPEIKWMSFDGIDEDILKFTLSEIRSVQVVRRELLKGNMSAAAAKDKKGEERAIEAWARVALRNPNDPMLLERLENLNRNAKGFLAVGKLLQAMKCYETVVLITPNDPVAVHNFGVCLKKLGKLDLAEKVLERARQLKH